MAGNVRSGFDDDDASVMSDINVVPLVDVSLVLLIVFMVTVPAIVASAPIKVDVPETVAAAMTAERLPLNLAVRREPSGEIGLYVNGSRTDEKSLRALVLELVQPGDEQETFLVADRSIPYGEVVRVMDMLAAVGLHKISLDTKHVSER
jgi:biopolymer transport protein ExbD